MTALKIIGAACAFMLVIAVLALATGGWQYLTAPFFGRVEAERAIESGPSRTALYDRFFDLCAGIQAIEGQIDAQSAIENERSRQNVAGLQGRRAQLIARYNADAAKDYTAARFRDADLPYHIPASTYDGSNRTICASR